MNPIVKQIITSFTASKQTVQEVVEKISVKAKASGKSFKEYVQDDANVAHISSVVYDALPFFVRFTVKSEAFNTTFIKNFNFIREKLFAANEATNPVNPNAAAHAPAPSPAPTTSSTPEASNTSKVAVEPVVAPKATKTVSSKPKSTAKAVASKSAKPSTTAKSTSAKATSTKVVVKKPAVKAPAKKSPGTQYTHGPARPPIKTVAKAPAKKVAAKKTAVARKTVKMK